GFSAVARLPLAEELGGQNERCINDGYEKALNLAKETVSKAAHDSDPFDRGYRSCSIIRNSTLKNLCILIGKIMRKLFKVNVYGLAEA
ncbi:hypothetical protein, partial [Corynebacterium sp. HMSC069E04]|uniref:hypothetical protein n=1 Tax=Corynebacterium sp. HMSC069E04 TaxID=1739400 RepID=UPI001AEFE1B0